MDAPLRKRKRPRESCLYLRRSCAPPLWLMWYFLMPALQKLREHIVGNWASQGSLPDSMCSIQDPPLDQSPYGASTGRVICSGLLDTLSFLYRKAATSENNQILWAQCIFSRRGAAAGSQISRGLSKGGHKGVNIPKHRTMYREVESYKAWQSFRLSKLWHMSTLRLMVQRTLLHFICMLHINAS